MSTDQEMEDREILDGPNPNLFRVAPCVLSTSLTIASGRGGLADSGALSQPFRRPFWLDEVRWSIRVPTDATLTTLAAGGLISAKFALGRMVVSNDFVPIHCYAPSFQFTRSSFGCAEECFDHTNTVTRLSFSHYRWKLPKPLFITPGQQFTCEYERIADGLGDAVMQIAYAGRYVDQKIKTPKAIDVPFISAWLPTPGSTFAQSSEKDLVNPLPVPLHCQRMIGRVLRLQAASCTTRMDSTVATPTDANIVIKDSYGHNVVRDFLNFYRVFDYNRRAWTFNRILPSKERYLVTAQNIPTDRRLHVALIGSRKEAL